MRLKASQQAPLLLLILPSSCDNLSGPHVASVGSGIAAEHRWGGVCHPKASPEAQMVVDILTGPSNTHVQKALYLKASPEAQMVAGILRPSSTPYSALALRMARTTACKASNWSIASLSIAPSLTGQGAKINALPVCQRSNGCYV